MNCDNHEFVTFSTCLGTRGVMVQCVNCSAFGVIKNPTLEEWSTAVECVRADNERVTIMNGGGSVSYVERA